MAEELWLPPEFWTDENLLLNFRANDNQGKRNSCFSYGFGNSYEPNSGPSSPGDSFIGLMGTENQEDDCITGLTRKMAYSTLRDPNGLFESAKGMGLSCSAKSTLCSVMGCHGCNQRPSHGNGNCIPRVPLLPGVKFNDGVPWDLYAAAAEEVARMRVFQEREVARMRMFQETARFYSSKNRVGVPFTARKNGPVTATRNSPSDGSGVSANQSHLSFQQLQVTQQLRLHHLMKQQQEGSYLGQRKSGYQQKLQNSKNFVGMSQEVSMAAWPTLQESPQQPPKMGSAMKALFLENPRTKKERTGTGVFLPKRSEITTQTRKKPGCSTFVIPDRVVQARSLNLESMDIHSQAESEGAALMYRNNMVMAQKNQTRNLKAKPAMNQEMRLPQEWTY